MMTGFEQYTRKTRRAIFLEEMEQVPEKKPNPSACAGQRNTYHLEDTSLFRVSLG